MIHQKNDLEEIKYWMQVMNDFLTSRLHLSQIDIDVYLQDLMPIFYKKGILKQQSTMEQGYSSRVEKEEEKKELSREDRLLREMRSLKKRMGSKQEQAFEACVNTIQLLVENIIKESEEADKFRQVKKQN